MYALYSLIVLLVPTTESLIGSRDRESNLYYTDLVSSEEFLGSHVLRIPNTTGPANKKDTSNVRDTRGKAKQVTTANGRTVIIKENSVYSNKGFKSLSQAQLLSDVLYYTPNNESQPWLIYYISKPLVGSFDPAKITPAAVPGKIPPQNASKTNTQADGETTAPRKRDIKTFGELLSNFPMIARQMQPGLDRLFREFGKELGKPLPPPPSQFPFSPDKYEDPQFKDDVAQQERLPFNSEEYFEDDEDLMRRSLETAVTAAIDLFRQVDKQQLSLLGATTDLTGPVVERLIERYVAEQVHESLLFPRLCNFRRAEDAELDARIRQMENVDVSQVGITIEGGRKGKQELLQRLGKGVEEFRKMNDANCPQDMLEVLLATIKVITVPESNDDVNASTSEKQASNLTVNADMLVSLLLIVVIRSQIRHLQARLLYMQHFIYVDDVESGEMGYALSTFEAVLTYLARNSAGLRKASARNKRLWNATKSGKISEMKAVLEPDGDEESLDDGAPELERAATMPHTSEGPESESLSLRFASVNGNSPETHAEQASDEPSSETPSLAHVFPFQIWTENSPQEPAPRPPKKVSMDVSSLSGSSAISQLSRTTIGSTLSGLEGDSSIETLTKTQDPAGDSVPMMAVESRQPEALKYLLSLREYYPLEAIIEDTNRDGTTLLSAAVQHAHSEIVDIIVDFLFRETDEPTIAAYLSKPDIRGRTVAHYLFSAPYLMSRLGNLLPWRQKDKHGQTPLFALCRSYDHPDYQCMVNEALTSAQKAQGDGKPLRLDDHVDAKGNTLLHIVSDPQITLRILQECDCDPNATNDKKFTPLMMASKYGRVDQMRTLFADPRVDIHLKESRGLTAVELAKDDEVRNRIDDLILFLKPPSTPNDHSGRITTVVRSFFVEDATVRFILKSGAPVPPTDANAASDGTYAVTTCRRTFEDFENLAKWLSVEHPASYMPSISEARNPFQIHSKPSRAVLHDMQENLDQFLKILLAHPTFATHEMLWEFFLVPELQPEMMADRSRRKASVLYESIYDDYEPVTPEGIKDTEQFVSHAQDMVRAVHANTRSVIRRGHALQHAASDLGDAAMLCASVVSTLQEPTDALPAAYVDAFSRYAAALSTSSSDSSPLIQFLSTMNAVQSTTAAILDSLARPTRLIYTLGSTNRNLSRSRSSLISSSMPRKFNLNLPVLEESRQKTVRELEQKIKETEAQAARLSREISWNKDVVVGELAGWTSWREKVGRDAIRSFAKATLVAERERGRRLERCLRSIKELSTQAPKPY
ncbi:VPS9 domain protein [Rasamsonia emersonii CBS 393.64]|uniref:VPS9 domain protein n=1 Tax=Rasamsonia emersonii (strain ATCC 16479 / CBS 393.64 / IMI 116815) TaxID=1408163 RepID=A0A0F4Z1N1_RASE3|nr:VPS9 domain protein [Rasamsonia emersonii CBS 393.64]KKA24006.1 VPS9 domain protein [Rasamsonia emersonii CBS 393.64]